MNADNNNSFLRKLEAPPGFEPGDFAKTDRSRKVCGLTDEDLIAMLAMAFPIPAGKTEQWKKFIGELTGAGRPSPPRRDAA
jgi:hypothetical protein